MFKRVKIVSADVYILAILIFRQLVMCFVRHNHSSGVERGQHTGIALAEEPKFIPLIRNFYLIFQIFPKSFYVESSICMKTGREVFTQNLQFFRTGNYSTISL